MQKKLFYWLTKYLVFIYNVCYLTRLVDQTNGELNSNDSRVFVVKDFESDWDSQL